jgi:hypothetical protein
MFEPGIPPINCDLKEYPKANTVYMPLAGKGIHYIDKCRFQLDEVLYPENKIIRK